MGKIIMEKVNRDTLISARENRLMFDKIASTYDFANRLFSLGMDINWRRRTIRQLSPHRDGNYLDIGTGTGDLALELLKQSPKSQVDAIDPSEKMLDMARKKSMHLGVSRRPRFQNADALHLPMPDNFFDGVISGFCFRNIEHRQKALDEMYRVVKPNGKVLVLEATYPSNSFIRLGYKLYTPIVPLIGKLFGDSKPYAYLLDSIEDFPKKELVLNMFQESGFKNITIQPLALGSVSIFEGSK